jgi:hypothetical protein
VDNRHIPAGCIGWLGQVARADALTIDDGPAHGTRMIRLVNGGGLEIELHPDRGLDIGRVSADGVPLAWISPVDRTAPGSYDAEGTAWLRTFGGGFLATCGLDTFGPPSTDRGVRLGMHGRVGATPATVTRLTADWTAVTAAGTIRQASVFGEHLVLERTVRSETCSSTFTIDDTVTNHGPKRAPHMILYHFNLGWPLVSPDTTVAFPPATVTPRDEHAAQGLSQHTVFGPPDADFVEQVFLHEPLTESEVSVTVSNPTVPLSVRLTYDAGALPALLQWKMQGEGHYVLGVEPANTPMLGGRAQAHLADRLPELDPGETTTYRLQVDVSRTLPEHC